MTTRTPSTFIIGAGPVATALAGALRRGGVPVLGLWARKPAAARAAGAIAGVAAFAAAPPDVLLDADAVVLAVRDSAIGTVAEMLVATGLVTRHQVLLHCSGALSAARALGAVAAQVRGLGTLHPLCAVADGRAGIRAFSAGIFGIEGDDTGLEIAAQLVDAMGARPLRLGEDDMALYHTAAVVASNYAVALIDTAASLLSRAGIDHRLAVDALLPLAMGSLRNVAARGVTQGLTGPIQRGDRATVDQHLKALAQVPETAELYRAMGRRTVTIARRREQADNAALDEIDALLARRK